MSALLEVNDLKKHFPLRGGLLRPGGRRVYAVDGVSFQIDKAETRIDWRKPWKQVHDHARGLSPFPGAWCEIAGARVKVLRTTKGDGAGAPGTVLDDALTIACGDGAIRILSLQPAGKRAMTADEYLRGARVAPGTVLP